MTNEMENLLEQFGKEPQTFVFKPEIITGCRIYYNAENAKYSWLKMWSATIEFKKDNITSEVKFEADTYKELYGKICSFLTSL
jgi:hypothetical protein